MYIKIYERNPDREIKAGYVFRTLVNLYIDYMKEQGLKCELKEVEDPRKAYEYDDREQELIDAFEKLPWYQQEFIEETLDKSVREVAEIAGVNYGFVHRKKHEGLNEIFDNGKETRQTP